MRYSNRVDAGRRLAEMLWLDGYRNPVVLGLTRGGIPVAYEVARRLGAPLDVMVARKVGAPGHPELAIAAVAPGSVVVSDEALRALRVPQAYVGRSIDAESREVERQLGALRAHHPEVSIHGRTVILVDDGIATGQTMLAAIESVRAHGAAHVVVAAPVAAGPTVRRLERLAEVRCHQIVEDMGAVGLHYDDFTPVVEADVSALVRRARLERETGFKAQGA